LSDEVQHHQEAAVHQEIKSLFPPRIPIVLIVCLMMSQVAARAADEEPVNLLRLPAAKIEQSSIVGQELRGLAALADGDVVRAATATAGVETPLTIVYGFGGDQVALERLTITVPRGTGDTSPPVRVDLLVSSLSAHSGFQSVRTDQLQSGGKPQEFPFTPIGAKWIMLRFFPGQQSSRVAIAEVSVLGYPGPPKTRYKFKESPAKAFDVLRKLESISALGVKITDDEAKLFDDAKDGKLDDWSFAEAALVSSGVLDRANRQKYLARLEAIEAEARKVVAKSATPFDKGRALLKYLHAGPMAKGYRSEQTDVTGIVDTGTFNCVSSATLYNIIGRRLGFDCRAIEVPEHAFSIIYDGTKHADVETTTAEGFNPSRDRAAQSEFTKLTGFVYVPETNRNQRREVDEVGLVAITYYNHGVELTRNKRYHEALLAYFRAMSLDKEFDSAVKNALSVLANWSVELAKEKKFNEAVGVISTGLELAPSDATLVHNHKAVWGEWAQSLIKDGKTDDALVVLRNAARAVPDGDFVKMQAWVVIGPGEELAESGQWEKALALVEPGLKKLDGEPHKEVRQWGANLYHRWSQSEQKAGRFDKAIDILNRALALHPDDKELTRHVAYVVQQWLAETYQRQGAANSETLVVSLLEQHGKLKEVREVAEGHAHRVVKDLTEKGQLEAAIAAAERNGKLLNDDKLTAELSRAVYDRHAAKFSTQKDWQKVVDVYVQALTRFPKDKHLTNNLEAAWDSWAREHVQSKEYTQALDVYEKALKDHPNPGRVGQNVRFLIQEWALIAHRQQGAQAAEKVLTTQLERFAAIKDIRTVARGHFQKLVQDLAGKAKYDEALAAVERSRKLLSDNKHVAEIAYSVYDDWAETRIKTNDWTAAVGVYRQGLEKFPKDSHLTNNAVATWNYWAKTFMDKQDWTEAIKVYDLALKQFPDNSTLVNNLKYCRQQEKSQK
jgi:tetratricopeptide (TPR) repeat protein